MDINIIPLGKNNNIWSWWYPLTKSAISLYMLCMWAFVCLSHQYYVSHRRSLVIFRRQIFFLCLKKVLQGKISMVSSSPGLESTIRLGKSNEKMKILIKTHLIFPCFARVLLYILTVIHLFRFFFSFSSSPSSSWIFFFHFFVAKILRFSLSSWNPHWSITKSLKFTKFSV